MVEERSGGRNRHWSNSTIAAVFQTFMYIQKDYIKVQVGLEREEHIV